MCRLCRSVQSSIVELLAEPNFATLLLDVLETATSVETLQQSAVHALGKSFANLIEIRHYHMSPLTRGKVLTSAAAFVQRCACRKDLEIFGRLMIRAECFSVSHTYILAC